MILVGLVIIFSEKYYSLLTKSYFFERLTEQQKEKTRFEIAKKSSVERYSAGILSLSIGVSSILWASKTISYFPFFILAALAFLMVIINYLKKP